MALITGAARGIGRATAVRLAENGADVVACDALRGFSSVPYPMATDADLAGTVEMVASTGRRCMPMKADVTAQSEMDAVVAEALREFGHIDTLVVNAGITSYGRSWELSDDQWDEALGVNLTGAWRTIRAALPAMIERGAGGAIVFVSSVAGLAETANVSHYVAAKHGVVGLMRALAVELARHSIRVNAVCPGNVDTPALRNDFVRGEIARRLVRVEAESEEDDLLAALAAMNQLPVAMIEPIDIANAILFLVSDMARFVTGTALPIDAGYLLHGRAD